MQNLTPVKPTIVNEIEFYVVSNGSQSGMSQIGLARLCNKEEVRIREILDSIVRGSTTSETLKTLVGKDLYLAVPASKNAKILRAEVCAGIIEYYAFEARSKSESALYAYRQFAKAGVHAWILSTTGFQTSEELEVDVKASLSGLEAVKKLARHYLNVSDNTLNKPGLAAILEDYSVNNYTNAIAPAKVTLKEYLAAKDIVLTKQQMGIVSGIVAGTYKLHRKTKPEMISYTYKTPNGKTAHAEVYGYSPDDFGLIDQALDLMPTDI